MVSMCALWFLVWASAMFLGLPVLRAGPADVVWARITPATICQCVRSALVERVILAVPIHALLVGRVYCAPRSRGGFRVSCEAYRCKSKGSHQNRADHVSTSMQVKTPRRWWLFQYAAGPLSLHNGLTDRR